jgi:hypothetical protein
MFALPVSTYAAQKQLTRNQLKALGVYYLDTVIERPSTVSGPVAGSGSCYELAMPQVNDLAVLAKAIDDHIKSKKPSSPFVGLGADIVFKFPILRHVMSWIGTLPAKRENIKKIIGILLKIYYYIIKTIIKI